MKFNQYLIKNMNFKPTLLKSIVSIITAIVSGYNLYSVSIICSVADCNFNFYKIYTACIVLAISVAILIYGIWSSLQKNTLNSTRISTKIVAVVITVLCSIILLYVSYSLTFK